MSKAAYFNTMKSYFPIYAIYGRMDKYVKGKVNVLLDLTGAKGKIPSAEFKLPDEHTVLPKSKVQIVTD